MKLDKHETDLYVLPENDKEKRIIVDFLESIPRGFIWSVSNVKNQDWHGKSFIDIPFGIDLKEQIENRIKEPEYKYEIMGKYKNTPIESIDIAIDEKDRDYLVNEYRLAYGSDWIISWRYYIE